MIKKGYLIREVHKTTERYFLMCDDISYKIGKTQFNRLMCDAKMTLCKQELTCRGYNPVTTYHYKRSV